MKINHTTIRALDTDTQNNVLCLQNTEETHFYSDAFKRSLAFKDYAVPSVMCLLRPLHLFMEACATSYISHKSLRLAAPHRSVDMNSAEK